MKFSDKREQQHTEAPDGATYSTRRHSRMVGTPDTLAPEVMGIVSNPIQP